VPDEGTGAAPEAGLASHPLAPQEVDRPSASNAPDPDAGVGDIQSLLSELGSAVGVRDRKVPDVDGRPPSGAAGEGGGDAAGELTAAECEAYAAAILVDGCAYGSSADGSEAEEGGEDEDEGEGAIYSRAAADNAGDYYGEALDGESVRRLALLGVDDSANAETLSGSIPTTDLLKARLRLLERRGRRRRAAEEAGATLSDDADTSSVASPLLAGFLQREQRYRRTFGRRPSDGGERGVGERGGDAGLPFEPVDPAAERRRAEFDATLRAVDHLPLAMAGQPLCVRCEIPTMQAELDANRGGICSTCYCQIHNERSSTAALGDQDPNARFRKGAEADAAAALDKQTTAAALQVTRNLISRRRPPAGYLQRPGAAARSENLGPPISMNASRGGAGSAAGIETGRSGRPAMGPSSAPSAGGRVGVGVGVGVGGGGGRRGGGASGGGAGGDGHGWAVQASDRSLRTVNPIRQLVQGIAGKPNPAKELIDLSVGDPTRYGNLAVDGEVIDKFCQVVRSGKHNGYTESMGDVEARRAVASRYSLPSCAPLSEDDVVLTSGVSGALELALGALANEGDNVLLPRPGFPLFKTMLDGFGVEAKYYSVLPERAWEVNVDDLAREADERTVAIVINNPSNPCGSVYSAAHIQAIVDAASALRLPIVADEVYADMAFSGHRFISVASMSADVPVLSVGGASKQFVVPGWRAGWLLIHDRNGVLEAGRVRTGIRQLTTRMLMTNAPVQAVLPHMLAAGTASAGFRSLMADLESNARVVMDGLAGCVGVTCVPPQGSMYVMVRVDVAALGFVDDLAFTEALRAEESVFVLPGQCFLAPNFVRLVFCAPPTVLREATGRIKEFCARHAVTSAAAAGRPARR
jgi:tyrosine aminotransferase